jgi:DNA-binding transcriptional ArsR family regulator
MDGDTNGNLGTVCFHRDKVERLRRELPTSQRLDRLADTFKAVSHPARLSILHLLAREEGCVCDVAHTLHMPVSTASQHLRKLRDAGLLTMRQDGKLALHSIAPTAFARSVVAGLNAREES